MLCDMSQLFLLTSQKKKTHAPRFGSLQIYRIPDLLCFQQCRVKVFLLSFHFLNREFCAPPEKGIFSPLYSTFPAVCTEQSIVLKHIPNSE